MIDDAPTPDEPGDRSASRGYLEANIGTQIQPLVCFLVH
jgi:hypothetical protein